MDHIQCEDERAQSSSAQLPHTRTLMYTHVHTRAVCTTHTLDQSRLFLLFFFFLLLWRSSSAAHAQIANKHTCTTCARAHTHWPGSASPGGVGTGSRPSVLPSFQRAPAVQQAFLFSSLPTRLPLRTHRHTQRHTPVGRSLSPLIHYSKASQASQTMRFQLNGCVGVMGGLICGHALCYCFRLEKNSPPRTRQLHKCNKEAFWRGLSDDQSLAGRSVCAGPFCFFSS